MKSTTILSLASLALLASAQPLNAPRHAHAAVHQRRGAQDRRQQGEVEVLVWVDTEGNQISASTTTLGPTSTSSSSSTSFTPIPTPVLQGLFPAIASASSTSSSSASAPTSTASSSSGSSGSSSSGYGVSYSPYNKDGTCKTAAQVATDFAEFGDEFSGGVLRSYGTDCNQVSTILAAAKKYNMKLFAGIYDLSTLSDEVALIVKAVGGDWSQISAVSVGNELVNNGAASAGDMVNAISTVRSLLKAAGYTGSVVTVDTLVATRNNPSIADASDFVAVNCHPFFDSQTSAEKAGSFIETQLETLRAVLSDHSKEIVVTETGWPWQGETNGAAVPSTGNQEIAIASIKAAFANEPEKVILFTPFNDLWKTNSAGEFMAEQYWGFKGYSPSG